MRDLFGDYLVVFICQEVGKLVGGLLAWVQNGGSLDVYESAHR